MYKVHLKKWDIIDLLSREGFYDMRNLSEEEKALFQSKEGCWRMLMDPLLHLVKADLRNFETMEREARVDGVKCEGFDNFCVLLKGAQVQ